MATLATQLFSREEGQEEDERLLSLFKNRVELKKEFAKLRGEREKLADQLKQQENATLRAQQKLEQLEGLLADQECAGNAIVFYQLRGVWQNCRRRMRAFAGELSNGWKEREHQQQIAVFENQRATKLNEIQNKVDELGQKRAHITAEIGTVEASRKNHRWFWNFFKRRELKGKADGLHAAQSAIDERIGELDGMRETHSEQPQPAFPGVSIGGLRSINLAIIALAQELYMHFSAGEFSNLAREASIRQVGDAQYGDPNECSELSKRIDVSIKALEESADLAARVQVRAQHLKSQVEYRRETDTVPVAGDLAEMPRSLENGNAVGQVSVNVLAEEFWDIFTILLT